MIRRPPRSTRTDTLFPTRRSSDLYKFIQMVISRGDESRTAHREIVDLTNMVFGRTVMTTEIKTSAEFDNSSARQQNVRSEEHTSELQSLMRISYAVLCLKKKKSNKNYTTHNKHTLQPYTTH